MKKLYIIPIIISFLITTQIYAQVDPPGQNSQEMASFHNEVDNIVPASPSVASLMRFEEIPVNEYTGIPDISIPLFSTGTNAKGVNFNMSLSYHPSSVAADEIASYTGLGWSLVVGGVISRTVRGIPDEYIELRGPVKRKVGIYYDSDEYVSIQSDINRYYAVEDKILNSQNNQDLVNEFKFMAYEKGKFDSQYDLYQFNVMGLSGRFIIKKEKGSNILTPVMIDDNRQYKIEVDYDLTEKDINNERVFKIKGFTLTDDNGVKYIFEEDHIEYTKEISQSTVIQTFESSAPNPTIGNPLDFEYPTAFHLSRIVGINDEDAVVFTYNKFKETVTNKTNTKNRPTTSQTVLKQKLSASFDYGDEGGNANLSTNMGRIEPWEIASSSKRETETQKLDSIVITDKAVIIFDISYGDRDDKDDHSGGELPKLENILIKDVKQSKLKEFDFEYDYFIHDDTNQTNDSYYRKRLILTQVNEYGKNSNLSNEYSFEYNKLTGLPTNRKIRKDPWGYFEFEPIHEIGFTEPIEKKYITQGTLKKMNLPTGGYIQFDFEPNTYSYEGDIEIIDFGENPNNYIKENPDVIEHEAKYMDLNGTETLILDNLTGEYLGLEFVFNPIEVLNWDSSIDVVGVIAKNNTGAEVGIGEDIKFKDLDGNKKFFRIETQPGLKYFLKTTLQSSPPGNGGNYPNPGPGNWEPIPIEVEIYKIKINTTKYMELFGGGVRIKDIKFYDSPGEIALQKHYNYSFFNIENRSSGSLAFAKPSYEFASSKDIDIINITSEITHIHGKETISYHSKTDFNNLQFLRTQGADVGYENVSITSVDNKNSLDGGRIENIYRSPREVPEVVIDNDHHYSYIIGYPFVPSTNVDYKRGQLLESTIFNSENDTIRFVKNTYEPIENPDKLTGVKLARIGGGNPYAYIYLTYSQYNSHINTCNNNYNLPDFCPNMESHWVNCDLREDVVADKVTYFPIFESSGWMQLSSTLTKDYFYEGSTMKIVETTQEYTYNDSNKQIKTQKVKNSLGEEIETEYTYPPDLSGQRPWMATLTAENRISNPVVVKTKNLTLNKPLTVQETVYDEFANGMVHPQYVFMKKGADESGLNYSPTGDDVRISYDKYDSNGNLQQYTLANGIPVSIIWGYNKQYPIAKVEGAKYTEINELAGILQGVSNSGSFDASVFEDLRNLEGVMVTGYIYDPMVGVTQIIQPNGQAVTYEYDSFGRLEAVKDHKGNVLQQIEYHYQTQQP